LWKIFRNHSFRKESTPNLIVARGVNLDFHKKMQLPDKSESTRTENVRPIGFLELLHSSPPLPTGRQAFPTEDGAFCGIFVNILLIYFNDNADGVTYLLMEMI